MAPSLRKFDTHTCRPAVESFTNGDVFPGGIALATTFMFWALPFTRIADELGDARAANMIMLGALLEITGALPQARIDAALRRLVKNSRRIEFDERAVMR